MKGEQFFEKISSPSRTRSSLAYDLAFYVSVCLRREGVSPSFSLIDLDWCDVN